MCEEPFEVIVHGVHSSLPIESLEHTAALIPGAVLEPIEGSGHFPWLEQPGALRRAAEHFL